MEKKKILFIEDDRPTIDIYKTAFEFSGFSVDVFDLGKKAIDEINNIEKGNKKLPDIILLDLILPDMSGIDILKEIKSKEKIKKVPVFVFSNYTDNEIEKMGEDLKPEKNLLKIEYSPKEMIEMIKKEVNKNKTKK